MFMNMYVHVGSKTVIIFCTQIPLPYKNQQNTTAAFRIRILLTLDAVCSVLYFEKIKIKDGRIANILHAVAIYYQNKTQILRHLPFAWRPCY